MEHTHNWEILYRKRGDDGILGIFTTLAFGGLSKDYDVLECSICHDRKKVEV